jgi:hypothetical protein
MRFSFSDRDLACPEIVCTSHGLGKERVMDYARIRGSPPPVLVVRLRITQRLTGNLDGIRLDHFEPPYVYEVGVLVGCYLLAIGAAEPVDDEGPALVLPLGQQLFGPPPLRVESRRKTSGATPVAEAADKPRRARKRRSKDKAAR